MALLFEEIIELIIELLYFALFQGKLDNAENLVRINVQLLVPTLFFKTVIKHSVYPHSAAF